MDQQRTLELLRKCEVELSDANLSLSELMNSDDEMFTDPDFIAQTDYLMEKVTKLMKEYESYLQLL